jgi:hypothetical protein
MTSTALGDNLVRAATVTFLDTTKRFASSDWNPALRFGDPIKEGDADREEPDEEGGAQTTHHVGELRQKLTICHGPGVAKKNTSFDPETNAALDGMYGIPCKAGQDECFDNAHAGERNKCKVCKARLMRIGLTEAQALKLCSTPLSLDVKRAADRVSRDDQGDRLIAAHRELERKVQEADVQEEERRQQDANAERGHDARTERARLDREQKMEEARAAGWDGEGGWDGYKAWKYPGGEQATAADRAEHDRLGAIAAAVANAARDGALDEADPGVVVDGNGSGLAVDDAAAAARAGRRAARDAREQEVEQEEEPAPAPAPAAGGRRPRRARGGSSRADALAAAPADEPADESAGGDVPMFAGAAPMVVETEVVAANGGDDDELDLLGDAIELDDAAVALAAGGEDDDLDLAGDAAAMGGDDLVPGGGGDDAELDLAGDAAAMGGDDNGDGALPMPARPNLLMHPAARGGARGGARGDARGGARAAAPAAAAARAPGQKGTLVYNSKKKVAQRKTRQTQKIQIDGMINGLSFLRDEASERAGVNFMPGARLDTKADCGQRGPVMCRRVVQHLEDQESRIDILMALLKSKFGNNQGRLNTALSSANYPEPAEFEADLTEAEVAEVEQALGLVDEEEEDDEE